MMDVEWTAHARAYFAGGASAIKAEAEANRDRFEDWRDVTLYNVGISTRLVNCFNNEFGDWKSVTLGQLADLGWKLYRIENLGRKSYSEICVTIYIYSTVWEGGEARLPARVQRKEVASIVSADDLRDAQNWRDLMAFIESRRKP